MDDLDIFDDPAPEESDLEAMREWIERFSRRHEERRAAWWRAEEEADRRAFAVGAVVETLDIQLARRE